MKILSRSRPFDREMHLGVGSTISVAGENNRVVFGTRVVAQLRALHR